MSSNASQLSDSSFSKETLPEAIQQRSEWVCWQVEEDGSYEAINPLSGEPIKSLDEGSTLKQAVRGFDTSDHNGLATVVHTGDEYLGIRLLDAVEEVDDGVTVDDWAENIIRDVDSYAELGPSDENICILTKANISGDSFESERMEVTEEGIIPLTGRSLEGFGKIQHRQDEMEVLFEAETQQESQDDVQENTTEIDEDIALDDVRETVETNFDEDQWHLTEAILSTHATLFIDGIQNCTGLIVVGKPGAGKTTALKFFE